MVAASRLPGGGGGEEEVLLLTARLLGGRCKRTCGTWADAAPYIQLGHHGDGPRPFPVGPDPSVCPEKPRQESGDWCKRHGMSLLHARPAQDLEKIQLRRHLLDVRRCCKNLPVERGVVVSRGELAFRPGNSGAAVSVHMQTAHPKTNEQANKKNYQTGPLLENSPRVEKHSDLNGLGLVEAQGYTVGRDSILFITYIHVGHWPKTKTLFSVTAHGGVSETEIPMPLFSWMD
ncbi:uncharacterized protein LOC118597454 [Onychomys torridus]|uniref:uncharacterized protein LOC118597454 n=1 Tax=Onychomys torridus TaxID=38674 RepID=UPI00167FC994|nr:uncharacterized protein LOC118597454 [Onychomys torridus]